jgi:HrpA-like RNA helicase
MPRRRSLGRIHHYLFYSLVCHVESGAKEKDYDPHLKTSTLQPTWISQSSSKQRKGRAGRTKAGVCFHMFSSRRYGSLRPFVESELLRTPLVSFMVDNTQMPVVLVNTNPLLAKVIVAI